MLAKRRHERLDEYRHRPGLWTQGVERAKYLSIACQIDARLFARLADRRRFERGVTGFLATAGEGHVPTPRVVIALGPFDQQQLDAGGRISEHEGDRGARCP